MIVAEVKKAVDAGAKEVFLLGQNVNHYGRRLTNEKINFTELLRRVSAVEGLERIRFTSPHPLHMDDEFIEEFARNPKICKSMHMPLQSGSTSILKAMKRGYSKEWFLNRAQKLRELVPDVSISTDIIVAFPGESEEDFADTMDVLNQVRFEQLFSFKYSPRPLTEAEKMEEVDSEVGSDRLDRLQARHDEILDEMKAVNLGKIVDVYFEELRSDGFVAGRSDNNLSIKVKGSEEWLGKIAKVKIIDVSRNVQYGEIIA